MHGLTTLAVIAYMHKLTLSLKLSTGKDPVNDRLIPNTDIRPGRGRKDTSLYFFNFNVRSQYCDTEDSFNDTFK